MSDEERVHGHCDPRFSRVREIFAENLRNGSEIGAAVAFTLDGESVVDLFGGYKDKEHSQPWESDTLVNVYSTTKGMTAICAHQLVEQGLLDLVPRDEHREDVRQVRLRVAARGTRSSTGTPPLLARARSVRGGARGALAWVRSGLDGCSRSAQCARMNSRHSALDSKRGTPFSKRSSTIHGVVSSSRA